MQNINIHILYIKFIYKNISKAVDNWYYHTNNHGINTTQVKHKLGLKHPILLITYLSY